MKVNIKTFTSGLVGMPEEEVEEMRHREFGEIMERR